MDTNSYYKPVYCDLISLLPPIQISRNMAGKYLVVFGMGFEYPRVILLYCKSRESRSLMDCNTRDDFSSLRKIAKSDH